MNQAITGQPIDSAAQSPGLLAELDLGRGTGRKKSPLTIELIRPLDLSDLPAIQNPAFAESGGTRLKDLRHSHHRLAELIAAGRPPAEISIITGYSPAYISSLKGDPAFNELVAYYDSQKVAVFADAMERLKSLGLDAIEKLQDRLHDPEKTWTNKELMDLVDMTLAAPAAAKQAPGPGGSFSSANLNLEVKFVGANPASGPVIDVTPDK